MAIKGSLREASFPDVLQLLAMGQKSGCLAVTDRSNFGSIYFDRGRIIHASIVNRPDRLGDLLVKNGLIDPVQLATAVEEQRVRPGRRLGEILVEQGAISHDQLERYVRLQIEEAVYQLFGWTQGTFVFEPGMRPEPGSLLVSLAPESVLLEGARRVDEWSLIEEQIPSFDVVFALLPDRVPADAAELTDQQRRIVPLIDGRLSVGEIVEQSGLSEFDVGKALFGLVQAGAAHAVGHRTAAAAEGPGSRAEEHMNLGLAFFRATMFPEAAEEFARVVDLEAGHLPARLYQGLTSLRAGDAPLAIRHFKGLVEQGGRWWSAFHNLGLALEQLGRYREALLAMEESVRLAPQRPEPRLSRAILLFRQGEVAASAEAFAAFRARAEASGDLPGAYFAWAVLVEAAAARDERALELGREGLAVHPELGPLLLHVGMVRERRGEWELAEDLYRRAAECDPDLPQAHKSLGDVRYRRGAYDQAADAYRRALALRPRLGDDACLKLGNIHYKRGERDQAIACWQRAVELNSENGIARTNLEIAQTSQDGDERPAVRPATSGPVL